MQNTAAWSVFATANEPEKPSHESGFLGHIFLSWQGSSGKANPDDHLPNVCLVDLCGSETLFERSRGSYTCPVRHTVAIRWLERHTMSIL